MKKFLWLVVIGVLLITVSLFCINTATAISHPPIPSSIPLPSSITLPTPMPIDPVINIPDANLRARLHSYTGIPESEDIHKSDLAALEGTIDLDHSEIANLEGIQYCTKITDLEADHNPSLTTLPNMTGMTKLEILNLRTCGFSSWPAGKLPPKLKLLDLSNNNLSALPTPFIDPCSTWKWLRLNNNNLSEFPEWLTDITGMEALFLYGNNIDEIPESINNMTALKELNISENSLDSIPDSICNMANLEILNITGNSLYSLPANIGNHIEELYASNNHIGTLPNSIGSSTTLKWLTLRLNRLTHLPSNFSDHTYTYIDIEFNFIDMSAGSTDRHIIDNTPVNDGKTFELQLKPITVIEATPTADSVTLTWQPGENGNANYIEWKVESYGVYLYDDSLTELAILDASTLEYTHTGLSPETEYQYRICVNYSISSTNGTLKNRCYTKKNATTLAVSEETTTAEPSVSISETEESVATTIEEPSEQGPEFETDPAIIQAVESEENAKKAFPIWAIIVIALVGAGALGAGLIFVVKKYMKTKNSKGNGV